ncbi:MAG: hypothetical protein Fur0018_17190 [Anaerolineales bacterium]
MKARITGFLAFALLVAGCVRPQEAVTPPPPISIRPTQGIDVYLPLVMRPAEPTLPPTLPPPPTATFTPVPTATSTPVALTFCASLPGGIQPIPDGDFGGLQSPLEVEFQGLLTDVQVQLGVQHTWVGDLTVTLAHRGTSVTLLERPGSAASPPAGCPQNDIQATFTDAAGREADFSCSETPPAIAGDVHPHQPLAAFVGLPAEGEWLLTVSDASRPDEGALTDWCLNMQVSR